MDLKLPNLGEGADSGVVVNILVKNGDSISEGQTVLELETEKAVAPIPASAAGKVTSVKVAVGDKVSVGAVLLTLEPAGAGASKAETSQPAAASETAPAPATATGEKAAAPAPPAAATRRSAAQAGDGEVAAAPSLRKLADDIGLDLRRIPGSARGGRITLEDIRAYIQGLQAAAAKGESPTESGSGASAPGGGAAAPPVDFARWGPVKSEPLSQLRGVIARRMAESARTVARVSQLEEADVTALMELRKRHAPDFEKRGARLTLTPLVLSAVVAALKKHPVFNATMDAAGGKIVFKQYYHIGIAVDTEAGLIVPVIRDADKKPIIELAKGLEDIARRTRERKITPEELKGGSFTISNQGAVGGGHFTPIINLPETAILGLGRARPQPVVRDGQIVARTLLPLTLSYDHRIIDGATAARFVNDLIQGIEQFDEGQLKAGD